MSKDVYKIIESTSVFPWLKFEVWIRGNVTHIDRDSYVPRVVENVITRCIYKTKTAQKAQDFITYWEEVAKFKGEDK